MSKVKIGIIGTGVGIRTHLSGFKLCEDAEVIAICGRSKTRSQEFAEKHKIPIACANYEELCNVAEIDLVCVTSPNRHHFSAVRYAIQKGKHIICEKPLSDNSSEVREIVNLIAGYDKIAVVDHQLRYNPYIQKVKELIDNGEVGRVYSVRLNQQGTGFANAAAAWCWSFEGKEGGGVRLAMASHFTDLIQYWFNNRRVISLNGFLNPVTKQRQDKDGNTHNVDASTICTAQINLADELNVQYYINAGSYIGSRFDISVFGDKGEIQYSLDEKISIFQRDDIGNKRIVDVSGVFKDEQQNKISIFSGSFRYFVPYIIKAIQTGDASHVSKSANFEDAIYNLQILDAIKESANKGISVIQGEETNIYV
jgi:predicted dehydrogenase